MVQTKVLDESDEERWRPFVGSIEQQSLCQATVRRFEVTGLDALVDRLLCHVSICRPLATYTARTSSDALPSTFYQLVLPPHPQEATSNSTQHHLDQHREVTSD